MKIVPKSRPFGNAIYRLKVVSLNADDDKVLSISKSKSKDIYRLTITDDIKSCGSNASYILDCYDTFEKAEAEISSIMKALENGESVYYMK